MNNIKALHIIGNKIAQLETKDKLSDKQFAAYKEFKRQFDFTFKYLLTKQEQETVTKFFKQ